MTGPLIVFRWMVQPLPTGLEPPPLLFPRRGGGSLRMWGKEEGEAKLCATKRFLGFAVFQSLEFHPGSIGGENWGREHRRKREKGKKRDLILRYPR